MKNPEAREGAGKKFQRYNSELSKFFSQSLHWMVINLKTVKEEKMVTKNLKQIRVNWIKQYTKIRVDQD